MPKQRTNIMVISVLGLLALISASWIFKYRQADKCRKMTFGLIPHHIGNGDYVLRNILNSNVPSNSFDGDLVGIGKHKIRSLNPEIVTIRNDTVIEYQSSGHSRIFLEWSGCDDTLFARITKGRAWEYWNENRYGAERDSSLREKN